MAGTLQFGVLGELEVRRDGAPLGLPSGRRRAVLAALIVRIGRPVPVDALVDAGWGGDVPSDPDGALRTVISRLRAVLGPDVVATTPEGYRLDVDPHACDAVRFELLCREARHRHAAAAAQRLDEALALWRGTPYGTFADHDFARPESARLAELRQSATEERAHLALTLGEPEDAVVMLETLVVEEPLREQALALLVESLYRCGRQADALDRLRRHRAVLAEELGLDPSPLLGRLEGQILRHELPVAASGTTLRHRPGLRVGAGTFVGREEDFAWLARGLRAFRLVCVTGPGGVGKTRLVAEVLARTSHREKSPAVVVRLGDVGNGEVCRAVAAAIDLDPSSDPAQESVVEALSGSSLVLALDNCEHVLEEVRPLVQAVNRDCPQVRVVATSRVRLGLLEEQVLPLEPLAVPDPEGDTADLIEAAAVELFFDRLRRVRPQLTETEEVMLAGARICRRLDGLPLAIELAATNAGALGVVPTLQRLDASLDLLGGIGADGDDVGMRAVIDWSYRLLDERDRLLLAALSVFSDTFDLDAAERVDPGADPTLCARSLARLVQASLVAVAPEPGPTRYRLLTLVRQFAQEQLAESGAAEPVQAAAAGWARDLAQECGHLVIGSHGADAMHRLDRNQAILVDGVRWSLAAGRLDLAAQTLGGLALCTHWRPGTVLLDLIEQVGRHPSIAETPGAALALAGAAFTAAERGQLDRAAALGERARRLARAPEEHATALLAMAVARVYSGDHEQARRFWQELAAIAGVPDAYQADAHAVLALLSTFRGDLLAARKEVSAAIEAAEASGSEVAITFARYAAGEGLVVEDRQVAIPVLRAAAEAADRVGAAQVGLVSRIALLSALTREGHLTAAVNLGSSLVELQRLGGRWSALWTTLRIVAELLARMRVPEDAALLLTAAEHARTAPVPFGADVERYRTLRADLTRVLGRERLSHIAGMARSLPRADVCQRAAVALATAAGS